MKIRYRPMSTQSGHSKIFFIFEMKTTILICVLIFLSTSSLAEPIQALNPTQPDSKKAPTINGDRMNYDPGHFSNEAFDDWERKFELKIQDGTVVEIFALLSSGYWGDDGQIIIYVGKKTIKLIYDQGWGKYSFRNFTIKELKIIKDFIEQNGFEDLSPLTTSTFDGIQYEYVHLDKNSGRRIYMNNPEKEHRPYWDLVQLFKSLSKSKNFKLGYAAVDNNPGALFLSKANLPNEGADYLKVHQQKKESCSDSLSSWQSQYRGRFLYQGYEGLYSCDLNNPEKRELIFKGNYANPVILEDGKIMVAAKTDTNWGDPNYIIIRNLETQLETKVELEPSDNLRPVAYLKKQRKVLIERFGDWNTDINRIHIGPEDIEYYFLDPATKRVEQVHGEFFPWRQHYHLPLQKVSGEIKVWFAFPRIAKNETELGQYDTENFEYRKIQTIKSIMFFSSHLWVDEERKKLYVEPSLMEFESKHIIQFPLN